jgi:hypothetical protein
MTNYLKFRPWSQNRAWHKTCLNRGIPVHLVDGKSDWLISIMKVFDWLQVHINNSFKNSSLKGSRRQLQVNYVKRSSFEFLNWLQFSSLLLQFKKLLCKSLEGIRNIAKSQKNFPQFLLEVLNFLLQVPNFLFCSARCNWLIKIIDQ